MNKKGFISPMIVGILTVILIIAYIFLKAYDVTRWNVFLVLAGITVGIIGNVLFVDAAFFINFALIGLVGAYTGLARYYLTSLPQIPTFVLILFSSYIIGSIISRFSRNILGVGT